MNPVIVDLITIEKPVSGDPFTGFLSIYSSKLETISK